MSEQVLNEKEQKRLKSLQNLIPGPKPRKKTKELRMRCEELTDECVDVLVSIMRNPKERTQYRIEAAVKILEYGHGKPKQYADVKADLGGGIVIRWADGDVPAAGECSE